MAENIFSDEEEQDSARASDIAYAVDVKFPDLQEEGFNAWRTNDVTSIQIIRNSLEKLASITVITLPLELAAYQGLELMLKQKKYPKVYVEYQQVDPKKPISQYARNYTVLNTFHNKKYRCVQMKQLEHPSGPARNIMVHLILSNEIVFYLSNSHRYNKVFYNKTLQWIFYYIDQNDLPNSGYQGFLRMFGKNSRNQNSIWLKAQFPDDFVNKFKYEQVLIKTHNDLHVIKYLMDTYKYTSYPSFIFFDDFYLPTPNREIELMAIMLMHSSHPANLRSYAKFNIHQKFFAEALDSLKMLSNAVINDHRETINYKEDEQESNILINTPGDFIHMSKKLDKKYEMPIGTQTKATGYTAKDELLYTKFKDSPVFDPATTPQLQANQSVRTFTVDTHDAQKLRMENCQLLLNKEIEGFYTFESNRIHFDAIQFERRYNFDLSDKENFSFVPVIIVNTFTRRDNKDTLLRHSCRFQCIRYITYKKEEEYPVKITGQDSNILSILENSLDPLAAIDKLNELANSISNGFDLQNIVSSAIDNVGSLLSDVTGSISNLTPEIFSDSLSGLKSIGSELGVDLNVKGFINDLAITALNGGDLMDNITNRHYLNLGNQFSNVLSQTLGNNQLSSAAQSIISGGNLSNVSKGLVMQYLQSNIPNINTISNVIEQVSYLENGVSNMLKNVSTDKIYKNIEPADVVHNLVNVLFK